ncbi:hypothetical protein BKA82DRAFT_4010922 [Pisolithus tinctorius]|nr:hypothetical protein BKA82DRAFT_4010922 [Pisolithus tinctorius]
MPPKKSCANVPMKIGPPVGVRKLKRIKVTSSPTKHQVEITITLLFPKPNHSQMMRVKIVALMATAKQPASQAMTDEEKEEQYLNSFCTKIIMLTSGKQLDSHVALQLLCASAILRQDVVAEDGPEAILPTATPADVSASPDLPRTPMDSEEDEQVIKNAMSSVGLDDVATDDEDNEANQQLHGAIRADGNAKHDLSSGSVT